MYIKKFTSTQIQELRQIVQANVNAGFRAEKLIDEIQDRFNVSKSKAKFLAAQETKLVTETYAQTQYKELGITKYVWQATKDGRTRDSHMHLDGTVQEFANPPIVDPKTGRRANAGVDFGCRCKALPIREKYE